MMRRPILLAAMPLFACMGGAAAMAQVASGTVTDPAGRQQFEVIGDSAPTCVVAAPSSSQGSNATFVSDGNNGGTVRITTLADPQTAEGNPVAMQVVLPVICNAAHEIVVRSTNGGLLRSGGSRAEMNGFVQFLPYRVSYDWAGQNVAGMSDDNSALDLVVPSPGKGDLNVAIRLDASTAPLVAGAYEDTLSIEITAAN